MLSLFQIDFAAREFIWAVCGGLVLALASHAMRGRISRGCRRFAERPVLPFVLVGLVMFAVQAGVTMRCGWPVPALHDEFSYLLAADTFSSGRATNPTPPAAEYFETYHVLSQPTYQSKYPPGNGLVLALGQVLTGQPIVGVWICLASATSGLFWMLRGWFASRWALFGAVILIGNWPVTKLWGQTYFGGAPALLGGVLVFGACVRLLRRPQISMAICLGLGLVIWAVTRPYEGLIASIIPLGMLTWHGLRTTGVTRSRWLTRVALPLVGVLVCGGALLGWYHQQVTGSPWNWPYRLYEATYTRRVGTFNTLFSWTPLGTRAKTIPSLEYQSSAGQMRIANTKPVLYGLWKTVRQWWFHVGLLWTLPLCLGTFSALRKALRNRATTTRPLAWAVASIVLVGTAILLQRSAGLPHYAAPIQPLLVLLIVQGLRHVWVWRVEKWRVGSVVVAWLAWSSLLFFTLPLMTGSNRPNVRPWSLERNRIQQELESQPRPSLVIIKYAAGHSMHDEWVYNRADLQTAHVIWARHLETSRLPQFVSQFPDREVWILEPDRKPVTFEKYRSEPSNLATPQAP
ncbi:MAG: hypothetical protein V4719_01895 [Planctomycetota bacterium]